MPWQVLTLRALEVQDTVDYGRVGLQGKFMRLPSPVQDVIKVGLLQAFFANPCRH